MQLIKHNGSLWIFAVVAKLKSLVFTTSVVVEWAWMSIKLYGDILYLCIFPLFSYILKQVPIHFSCFEEHYNLIFLWGK